MVARLLIVVKTATGYNAAMITRTLRTLFRHSVIAGLSLVLAVGLLLPATVHADTGDTEAIADTSAAVDKLYGLIQEATDITADPFVTAFTAELETARKTAASSYTALSLTTEKGQAATAVWEVQDALIELKKVLYAWPDIARAKDSQKFEAQFQKFDHAVDSYNLAVDSYNTTPRAVDWPYLGFGFTTLGLIVIGPVLLWWRSRVLRRRAELPAKTADNRRLLTNPRRFFVLTVLTCGLYACYWGWQSWEILQRVEERPYRTAARGLFISFTSFPLFRKLHELASATGYTKLSNHRNLAYGMLGLYLLSLILSPAKNPYFILGSTLLFGVVEACLLLPAVRARNAYVQKANKPILHLGKDLLILSCLAVCGLLVGIALITAFTEPR